jgi:septation ring formation regulator EzrA
LHAACVPPQEAEAAVKKAQKRVTELQAALTAAEGREREAQDKATQLAKRSSELERERDKLRGLLADLQVLRLCSH